MLKKVVFRKQLGEWYLVSLKWNGDQLNSKIGEFRVILYLIFLF